MSFTRILIGSAEKPKRSFKWSLSSVRQQVANCVTLLTTYLAKNQCSKQHQQKMSIDFKNNIKNITTTSPDYQLFSGQSKVCFQFCFQVRRPVFSAIVNPFMSFYEKSLLKYFLKIQNVNVFLFLKKQPQKRTNFSTFYFIFTGPSFQYHKVKHPNFL